jgi:hypothetical protein
LLSFLFWTISCECDRSTHPLPPLLSNIIHPLATNHWLVTPSINWPINSLFFRVFTNPSLPTHSTC